MDLASHQQLARFRTGLYDCLTSWPDTLFELADAALSAPGPLHSVPALSLEPEFRRSHGSLYKALANGHIDTGRLDRLLVAHRPADWPNVFAVDASTWDRCDAETSPGGHTHPSHDLAADALAALANDFLLTMPGGSPGWLRRRLPRHRSEAAGATVAGNEGIRYGFTASLDGRTVEHAIIHATITGSTLTTFTAAVYEPGGCLPREAEFSVEDLETFNPVLTRRRRPTPRHIRLTDGRITHLAEQYLP